MKDTIGEDGVTEQTSKLFFEIGDEGDNGLTYIHVIFWNDKDKNDMVSEKIEDFMPMLVVDFTEKMNGVFKYSGGMTLRELYNFLVKCGFKPADKDKIGELPGVDRNATIITKDELEKIQAERTSGILDDIVKIANIGKEDKDLGNMVGDLYAVGRLISGGYEWTPEEQAIIDIANDFELDPEDKEKFDEQKYYDKLKEIRDAFDNYVDRIQKETKVKHLALLPASTKKRIGALEKITNQLTEEIYSELKRKKKKAVEDEEIELNKQERRNEDGEIMSFMDFLDTLDDED